MSDAITCRLCAAPPVGGCPRCGHRMCADHVPRYVGLACVECEAAWHDDRRRSVLRVAAGLGGAAAGLLAVFAGLAVLALATGGSLHTGIGAVLFLLFTPYVSGAAAMALLDRRVLRPRFLRPTDPHSLPPARLLR